MKVNSAVDLGSGQIDGEESLFDTRFHVSLCTIYDSCVQMITLEVKTWRGSVNIHVVVSETGLVLAAPPAVLVITF